MKNIGFVNNDKMLLLNFTQVYCKSSTEVLNSECFKDIFSRFVTNLEKHDRSDLLFLLNLTKNPRQDFVELFKLLHILPYEEISTVTNSYDNVLKARGLLYQLVEEFYNYWRKLERYSLLIAKKVETGVQSNTFVESNRVFTEVILSTYRSISQKINGSNFSIYRQLPAGINASMLINEYRWAKEGSCYEVLNDIQMIESLMIRPPFISYSKKNKRTGVYPITYKNPLIGVSLDPDKYLCFPAKVGSSLAFIYFHRDFMAHGIAVANLFEIASSKDYQNRKPDLVYVFGYGAEESRYFYDEENNIYVGMAPLSSDVDYFGYMKKMLLTLHNTKMIKEGGLPIHGACVNIILRNKKVKTVVIIGDSGAGKSETLAALSECAGDDIVAMYTVFDDMGTFKMVDGKIKAFGTEIGAFVRLDDMSSDYAYREMDRAIFMNPDKINARLVIPVSTYDQIMRGYNVDMVLYANNYDDKDEIAFFKDKDEALNTFVRGARKAKGTTGEVGLVESFFANPFGPVQMEEETRVLLDQYYQKLFDDNILVGEIYTKLAIDGNEHSGPEAMAKKLFNLLKGE